MSSHSVQGYRVGRLSDPERVEGQYGPNVSSHGPFDAYLLNTTEYGNLINDLHPAAPPPDGRYLSHCRAVSGCNLSVGIPGSPIAYVLALVNYANLTISFEWIDPNPRRSWSGR